MHLSFVDSRERYIRNVFPKKLAQWTPSISQTKVQEPFRRNSSTDFCIVPIVSLSRLRSHFSDILRLEIPVHYLPNCGPSFPSKQWYKKVDEEIGAVAPGCAENRFVHAGIPLLDVPLYENHFG